MHCIHNFVSVSSKACKNKIQLPIKKLEISIAGPFGPIWLNQYTVRLTPFQVKYVEVFQEEPVGIAELFLTEECDLNLARGERANERCITLVNCVS